jgi:hypothetical protein
MVDSTLSVVPMSTYGQWERWCVIFIPAKEGSFPVVVIYSQNSPLSCVLAVSLCFHSILVLLLLHAPVHNKRYMSDVRLFVHFL